MGILYGIYLTDFAIFTKSQRLTNCHITAEITKDIRFLDSETQAPRDETFLIAGKFCRRPSENGFHSDHGPFKNKRVVSRVLLICEKNLHVGTKREIAVLLLIAPESQTVGSRPATYGLYSQIQCLH
jgi:hypothetical protein